MGTIMQVIDRIFNNFCNSIIRDYEQRLGLSIASTKKPSTARKVFGQTLTTSDGRECSCVGILVSTIHKRSQLYVITSHTSMDDSEFSDEQLIEHFKKVTGVVE